MFQLREETKTFYNTDDVDTLLNNYGKLTIMTDGETVAEIQSIKPLTWRVPVHMLHVFAVLLVLMSPMSGSFRKFT